MSILAWLLLIWIPGSLWGFRFIVRASVIEEGREEGHYDWEDVFLGFYFGILGCGFWPLYLLASILKGTIGQRDPDVFLRRIAGQSREQKRAAKEKELKEREHKLAEAERELGLVP